MAIDFELDPMVATDPRLRACVRGGAAPSARTRGRREGRAPDRDDQEARRPSPATAPRSCPRRRPKARAKKPIGSMIAVVGSEELAWGDPAVLLNIPGPGLAAPSILAAGTDDQKKRFLSDVFGRRSRDEPRSARSRSPSRRPARDVSQRSDHRRARRRRLGPQRDEDLLHERRPCRDRRRERDGRQVARPPGTEVLRDREGDARLQDREDREEDGAHGVRDRRAHPRGLPDPVRQHPRRRGGARAEGLRLQGHDEGVRLVAALGRGDGSRDRTGRVRVRAGLGAGRAPHVDELHAARRRSSRSSAR